VPPKVDSIRRRRSRRRHRKKTGACDSFFARLITHYYVYSNEDFTVISLRLPVP